MSRLGEVAGWQLRCRPPAHPQAHIHLSLAADIHLLLRPRVFVSREMCCSPFFPSFIFISMLMTAAQFYLRSHIRQKHTYTCRLTTATVCFARLSRTCVMNTCTCEFIKPPSIYSAALSLLLSLSPLFAFSRLFFSLSQSFL